MLGLQGHSGKKKKKKRSWGWWHSGKEGNSGHPDTPIQLLDNNGFMLCVTVN